MTDRHILLIAAAAFALPALSAPAAGQDAGKIVTQPARDVGADKTDIPASLERAAADPYSQSGVGRCAGIAREIAALNDDLGPDFGAAETKQASQGERLARAGGTTLVNSIIPFRSLVREVSGAAPAERRLRAAQEAGLARRGFLRGLQSAKGCRR